MITPETVPVLVYTDDGRDVDDIEALAYLAGAEETEIVGVVTTHMIPDRRAFIARAVLNGLGSPDTPIGVGSVFPLGKEDELLGRYLREHTIENRTYEGDGLIECFPDAIDLIHQTIDTHGPDLRIAALAPLTDLAKAAERDRENFTRIGGLFIQGQAIVEDGRLQPDPAAYNLKEDMEAATRIFALQDDIPLTLVGKWAAYKIPLLRSDFERFAGTSNPVGAYLKTHAEKGIACFAERAPEIFERVFKVSPDRLEDLQELSKPYDALVAVSIARPAMLGTVSIGHHTLIGMSPETSGIEDEHIDEVKAHVMRTIVAGLEV
jgi:inosine-uridine nucleoside N-ribohydrolase